MTFSFLLMLSGLLSFAISQKKHRAIIWPAKKHLTSPLEEILIFNGSVQVIAAGVILFLKKEDYWVSHTGAPG